MLTDGLAMRLTDALGDVCAWLGSNPERAALTTGTRRAGAQAAVTRSLPLGPGEAVVILGGGNFYPSILRGWQQRCAEAGAQLHVVDRGSRAVLSADVRLAQGSIAAGASASRYCSSARSRPRPPCSSRMRRRWSPWGHGRGARVIVDGARGPGQRSPGGRVGHRRRGIRDAAQMAAGAPLRTRVSCGRAPSWRHRSSRRCR